MGKFFVKRKDYDLLVEEMQELQEDYNYLKDIHERTLRDNRDLVNQNKDLKQLSEFLSSSKKRVLKQMKIDNENKNKHIESLIKENTELYNEISDFKINIFNSIQANIKNRKKLRIRNKQNKKLNNDVVQHLVNIALEK